MSSSPEALRTTARESVLLRGASASAAAPYRSVPGTTVPPRPRPVPVPPPVEPASPVVATAPEVVVERRVGSRRAADVPVPNGRGVLRLGDVYAEELTRLREFARAEGHSAGYAEGLAEASRVVAQAEAEAEVRLADVQARWERRMVSATAALGAAVAALEAATVPTADDVRDTLLDGALTLVEDLLGRELSASTTAGVDAVRRALTLVPSDAPAVVRLHPDDLAEVPPAALAALPPTVTVVGDAAVERAGAVAECGPRRVDAQLSTALARVRAVLSGGGPS
ncbi:flagellar assembly protein FliH [Geodermatophilus dictyosporus]|uniref:Flagellar assembly protein FliH n=1 Tax=Geodermatophilus dictyosporus TaxID=1523247 RepID=A0A1I5NQY5_9ACTN|nr:FliH/SctL family protein [Geodermatophilus dictyosporus]SFP24213.1 flagellar assembly protein FliH [Geodermatophilus dictyosporus]